MATEQSDAFVERARQARIIAILRAPTAEHVQSAAEALYEAGCRAIEVTMTTSGAVEAIARLRKLLPADAWIGAGTVMTADDVRAVTDAGAEYLISPVTDVQMIEEAQRQGVPAIPGALTPTEIVAAWRAGAAAVKVSPVSAVGGVDFVRQVSAFLPGIPLVPTGGVELGDVQGYLAAGCPAVGLGAPLLKDALTAAGDLDALRRRTREVLAGTGAAGA